MSATFDEIDVEALTPEQKEMLLERLVLAIVAESGKLDAKLIEKLSENQAPHELSEAEKKMLSKEKAEYEENLKGAISWAEFKEQLSKGEVC